MDDRRRIAALALVMLTVALMVGAISVVLPYRAAFAQTEARLTETARSQARIIEAVARDEVAEGEDYPGGAAAATLSQIREAHQHYEGIGETGEFTLARGEGDQIVFLLNHRHFDRDVLQPVPFDSEWAEPMRRALSGQSGTVVGLDYRGEMVLAAYEPVAELDLGIVAKIDLAEIRAPFVKTSLVAGVAGLLVIVLGAALYVKATSRLLQSLEERDRLLNTFHSIGVVAQQPLVAREMLSELSRLVVEAGLSRSLAASIVDPDHNCIEEVCGWYAEKGGSAKQVAPALFKRDLDGPDILARVVQTAQLEVIEGWDEAVYAVKDYETPDDYADKVAYFLPVAKSADVVAVLATASTKAEKAEVLGRIEAMQPMLAQMAIALEHARLYETLQGEVAERKEIATRREAVSRVRASVWQMTGQGDLEDVLTVIGDSLRDAGVAFRDCGINLVTITDSDTTVRFYDALLHDWVGGGAERGAEVVLRIWRTGSLAHRPDLLREDAYGEAAQIERELGHPVRSVVDVPFADGTLAVSSYLPDAFSKADLALFQEIAAVLSEGFQRARDLAAPQESEERLRSVIETTLDYILMLDRDLKIQFANRASPGLTVEALEGTPLSTYLKEDRREEIEAILQGVLRTGAPARYETEYSTPGGEVIYYESQAAPRRLPDSSEIVGLTLSARDITEHKRLEQEVIHLERMRVSGELAAGVSHNLNNMLTAVLGPAQMLLRKSDDPRVQLEAKTILTAGRRAQDLVSKLDQSVRMAQQATLGSVPVNEEVQRIVEMCSPRWRDEPESRGITIEVATDLREVPEIRGTSAELGDALLNLLLNAIQAMPEGGSITIATQAVEAGVQLTVRDTGVGMDEETRRRVFEPFFTTKRDVGSGLGLSMVHGTVARWGGTIEVDSTPGEGTTFTVWLPAWTKSAVSTEAPAPATSTVRPGRLLVVDDDEDVCGVLDSLLSEAHTVVVVRDGRQSLEQFVPGQYDVALIDLGMPGLAGDQVAAQMRQLDPALATVLITGWVLEPEDARLRWFDLQIPKPFADLNEVESVVAQAIGLHDSRG